MGWRQLVSMLIGRSIESQEVGEFYTQVKGLREDLKKHDERIAMKMDQIISEINDAQRPKNDG